MREREQKEEAKGQCRCSQVVAGEDDDVAHVAVLDVLKQPGVLAHRVGRALCAWGGTDVQGVKWRGTEGGRIGSSAKRFFWAGARMKG